MMLCGHKIPWLLSLQSLLGPASAQQINKDPGEHNLNLVDPLIGSVNGGNVFAGASLPYGMAKAVADVSGQDTAGFAFDGSNVTGFSSLHDSGTGGQPSLGLFPLSIQTKCPGDVLESCIYGSKYGRAVNYMNDTVQSRPGYFSLGFPGFTAEMTTAQHTALYNFNFNSTDASPLVLLDLTDLQDSRQNATISVDPQSGRIKANGTFLPSFGVGSYMGYTCVDFKGADIRDTGVWVNSRPATDTKSLFVNRGYSLFYIQAGGLIRFKKPQGKLQARVGLSFISSDRACENAEREIPDFDFDKTYQAAKDAWKEKLGGITIDAGGAPQDLQKTFFSNIYRTHLDPMNWTGENPLWESNEPYFESFYAIWDIFRTTAPMLTIIDPAAMSQMVRTLIDIYKHLGWMPDSRMSLCKGYTQGGSNADIILTDAYVKNLSQGIDWEMAYKAVQKDAEDEPFDWGANGRGGLTSWKRVGYIPVLDTDTAGFGPDFHSISRTLEYSYNDFGAATLAKGLGKTADAEKYLQRSGNWKNLFKKDQSSFWPNGTNTGFVGFFQPRYLNGTWAFQDPMECSPLGDFCSYSSNPKETFEDSIWEYNFFVPQDQASLINTLGGPDEFIKRLDYLHSSGLTDVGNEPSFLTYIQYHYAGRPGKSGASIRSFYDGNFNSTMGGLPGNDDSGAMAALAAFWAMGLFPNAGQNVYLITPPFFKSLSFTSPLTGKTATIKCVDFDPEGKRIYIQKVMLNGEPYTKNWIGHEFFLEGWTLELTMGDKESEWGTKQEDLPPSASSGHGSYMY